MKYEVELGYSVRLVVESDSEDSLNDWLCQVTPSEAKLLAEKGGRTVSESYTEVIHGTVVERKDADYVLDDNLISTEPVKQLIFDCDEDAFLISLYCYQKMVFTITKEKITDLPCIKISISGASHYPEKQENGFYFELRTGNHTHATLIEDHVLVNNEGSMAASRDILHDAWVLGINKYPRDPVFSMNFLICMKK